MWTTVPPSLTAPPLYGSFLNTLVSLPVTVTPTPLWIVAVSRIYLPPTAINRTDAPLMKQQYSVKSFSSLPDKLRDTYMYIFVALFDKLCNYLSCINIINFYGKNFSNFEKKNCYDTNFNSKSWMLITEKTFFFHSASNSSANIVWSFDVVALY